VCASSYCTARRRSSKQNSAHHARELGTAGGGGNKTRQKDGTEEGGPQEYVVYSEAVLLSAIVNSFGIQGGLRQEVDERCRQDLLLGTQFTRVTGTRVQILTKKARR
jgi:hypothetical protein